MINQDFWENKWSAEQTPWDIGAASPAICRYIDGYTDKNAAILIPGCGNAHEAVYLLEQGFKNITLLDIAETAVKGLKERFKEQANLNILLGDFFEHQHKYDLILEQTFFCAIDPSLRNDYAKQMASLLNDKGILAGLLFNKVFDIDGPPFGGTETEYKTVFEPYFDIVQMEDTALSIDRRKDNELFFILKRK